MTPNLSSQHIISTSGGGAQKAVQRLVLALNEEGAQARIRSTLNAQVSKYRFLYRAMEWTERKLLPLGDTSQTITVFPRPGSKWSLTEPTASITHLHWITPEVLRFFPLFNTPVVWTLHDAWPFTGGCHYPGTCSGYEAGCNGCPVVRTPFEGTVSRGRLRKELLTRNKVTAVAPSRWMMSLAVSSGAFSQVFHIPNCIDDAFLQPVAPRDTANRGYKEVIGVAADWSERRKGLQEILGVAQHLAHDPKIRIRLIGKTPTTFPRQVGNLTFLGAVHDVGTLIRAFDSAHAFINFSSADNLPSTLIEAQARRLPVVTSPAGGSQEIVTDSITGYVRDSPYFAAKALERVLSDPVLASQMGQAGRNHVEKTYSPQVVAKLHLDLYSNLLAV